MRTARPASVLVVSALMCGLTACITTPPPHPRALENNELCAQQIGLGDLQRAEVYCDLALDFAPHYADVWSNKGLILFHRGQIDQAKEAFIKALRYNQEQAQAYNNLGVIYLEHEKSLGRAHDNFQRALKVNPDYTEARYNLARTFRQMKKYPEARKELMTIVAINPSLADPYHELCLMDLDEGQLEEAISQCSKAVQLAANFAGAWLSLGVALLEAGRCPDAPQAFSQCIEADPNLLQCRHNLPIANRKCALSTPEVTTPVDTQIASDGSAPALFELARSYQERGLRNEEERQLKKCVQTEVTFAPCHYRLHEIFKEDRRDRDASAACKNFLKIASSEQFPGEIRDCERYLSSSR